MDDMEITDIFWAYSWDIIGHHYTIQDSYMTGWKIFLSLMANSWDEMEDFPTIHVSSNESTVIQRIETFWKYMEILYQDFEWQKKHMFILVKMHMAGKNWVSHWYFWRI